MGKVRVREEQASGTDGNTGSGALQGQASSTDVQFHWRRPPGVAASRADVKFRLRWSPLPTDVGESNPGTARQQRSSFTRLTGQALPVVKLPGQSGVSNHGIRANPRVACSPEAAGSMLSPSPNP